MRSAIVILVAGIMSSLADWFFAGDWLHRRWTYRDVWRAGPETRAIALTTPLPFLTILRPQVAASNPRPVRTFLLWLGRQITMSRT
jgi:hypothetical protein